MKYIINNHRLGEPGTEYVPEDGINVDALLMHGFIFVQEGGKSAKTKTSKTQPDSVETSEE